MAQQPLRGAETFTAKVGAPVLVDGWAIPKRATYTLTDEGGGGLTARFEVRAGAPVCTELHLTTGPEGRLTDAELRRFNLAELTTYVFSKLAAEPRWQGGHSYPAQHGAEAAEAVKLAQRTAELAAIARTYLSNPRAGTATVVAVHGLARRTAVRRVDDARRLGLLPKRGADEDELAAARAALEDAPGGAMTIDEAQQWLARRMKGGE